MNSESISLGWNCESAIKSVNIGIRKRKIDGYLTCPFDECITNYDGIILCIKEDFKYLCDISYLQVIPAKFSTGGVIKGEKLLYNTRYNFIFNHESPDHANLYISQKWAGGKNHYIANNFALFIERYTRRISNFRSYIRNEKNAITFVIGMFSQDTSKLSEVIKDMWPNLVFSILCYTPSDSLDIFNNHHTLMFRTDDHV